MSRRLPPLNTLRAFEAAARHLSFKHAANELFVTAGAVSQHIKSLEDTLGVPLFFRRHKSLELTSAGHAYYPVLRDAFKSVSEATERIFPRYRTKTLVIGVQASFAVKWLYSRLALFTATYPGIDIRISSSIETDDLVNGRVEGIIRYGAPRLPGLRSFHILPAQLYPVCNPKILERGIPLNTPEDLRYHTLIHDEFRQGWQTWLSTQGVQNVDTSKGPSFTDDCLALQAAIEGLGVVLGRSLLVEQDILHGRLMRPFKTAATEVPGYFLVCLEGHAERSEFSALRNWITSEARGTAHNGSATAIHQHETVTSPSQVSDDLQPQIFASLSREPHYRR
ncbi:MAG: LysR family transcriptional regulator, glycine cleavage system transcriptional activator [Alphaproteobacteria bacterium]|nr:LysR family transcriptional regulator, glycine cleavage system transcriptional activator [Alphaproteobacteria bacterium]